MLPCILLLAGSDSEFSTKIITGWKFVSVFELIVVSVVFCMAVFSAPLIVSIKVTSQGSAVNLTWWQPLWNFIRVGAMVGFLSARSTSPASCLMVLNWNKTSLSSSILLWRIPMSTWRLMVS